MPTQQRAGHEVAVACLETCRALKFCYIGQERGLSVPEGVKGVSSSCLHG